MPSLNELRRKVKSIKSTQQITKAMKMIAGARLARAQKILNDSRYCADTAQRLMAKGIGSLEADYNDLITQRLYRHPFLRPNFSAKLALVVVTADKGLCAGFNANVLRKASEFISANKNKEFSLFLFGKKACDYFSRRDIKAISEYSNLSGKLDFSLAERIACELSWYYINEGICELTFIYNRFRSVIKQEVTLSRVLPFDLSIIKRQENASNYLYEPGRENTVKLLFAKYIAYRVYGILTESYAAELAARMTAMDQATKNAHELIESLTLEMNKVRQAGITRELADIVGTSEVLR
jgi:F-type H+-transporting ATPase subunit gamma